jgi:hypothetical protein
VSITSCRPLRGRASAALRPDVGVGHGPHPARGVAPLQVLDVQLPPLRVGHDALALGHLLGRRRQHVARGRAPDRLGAAVVGVHAREEAEVGRHRGDHAGGLLRVLVDHEHGAQHHRLARRARLPHIDHHQPPGQRQPHQVDREPLALVEHHGALQRQRNGRHATAQQQARRALQAQADHGRRIAQEVEQRGHVAAVGVVLGARQLHERAVDAHDDQADQHIARQRRHAAGAAEQRQRHQRADEVDGVGEPDELVLRKVRQRAAGLVHAVLQLARVVAVVPGQRRGGDARVQLVGQPLAHLHAHVALQDAARPVQHPGAHVHAGQRGDPAAGAAQVAALQRVDGLPAR